MLWNRNLTTIIATSFHEEYYIIYYIIIHKYSKIKGVKNV